MIAPVLSNATGRGKDASAFACLVAGNIQPGTSYDIITGTNVTVNGGFSAGLVPADTPG